MRLSPSHLTSMIRSLPGSPSDGLRQFFAGRGVNARQLRTDNQRAVGSSAVHVDLPHVVALDKAVRIANTPDCPPPFPSLRLGACKAMPLSRMAVIWSAAAKRPRSTTVAGTMPVILKVTRQVSITPLPVFGAVAQPSARHGRSGHPISIGLRRGVTFGFAAHGDQRHARVGVKLFQPSAGIGQRAGGKTTNWANNPVLPRGPCT